MSPSKINNEILYVYEGEKVAFLLASFHDFNIYPNIFHVDADADADADAGGIVIAPLH